MAKLKTDFKDDIFSAGTSRRKYNKIDNSDGTISLEDVTSYDQTGDNFGAKQINEANQHANQIEENVCTDFSEDIDYKKGEYVIHEDSEGKNKLYKFTAAHSAGQWDESNVEETSVAEELSELTENMVVKYGTLTAGADVTLQGIPFVIKYGHILYVRTGIYLTKALADKTSIFNINFSLKNAIQNMVIYNTDGSAIGIYVTTNGEVIVSASKGMPAGSYFIEFLCEC